MTYSTTLSALRGGRLKPPPGRDRRGAARAERLRTAIGIIGLIGLFSLILFTAVAYIGTVGRRNFLFWAQTEPLPPDAAAARRHGSIVLVPWSGKKCEERLFDNLTGNIGSESIVDCDLRLAPLDAAAAETPDKDARTRAILNAFKR